MDREWTSGSSVWTNSSTINHILWLNGVDFTNVFDSRNILNMHIHSFYLGLSVVRAGTLQELTTVLEKDKKAPTGTSYTYAIYATELG